MVVGTTTQVVMPRMGDSVSEGTVLEWHRSEGDHVSAEETLVEVSTDKVDAEVPSPVSGTLVRIHAPEGETVRVGALIAEIALDGSAPDGAPGTAAGDAARATVPPAAPAATDDTERDRRAHPANARDGNGR